jgi:hypothetical protein
MSNKSCSGYDNKKPPSLDTITRNLKSITQSMTIDESGSGIIFSTITNIRGQKYRKEKNISHFSYIFMITLVVKQMTGRVTEFSTGYVNDKRNLFLKIEENGILFKLAIKTNIYF